ncbi:hypothetical protein [Streptomyces sp. URMC 124]|uniref:hypothetical protein n=1 Tax=Streptomyces sp. URMC 124 TaxID=3423405 RepID=UPI003F1CF31B
MTTGPGPQIAADGIQEVPLTVARALLTRLIEQVREDGLVSALTVRGRRRAYLVTPEFYSEARKDSRRVKVLTRAIGILSGEEQQRLNEALAQLIEEPTRGRKD